MISGISFMWKPNRTNIINCIWLNNRRRQRSCRKLVNFLCRDSNKLLVGLLSNTRYSDRPSVTGRRYCVKQTKTQLSNSTCTPKFSALASWARWLFPLSVLLNSFPCCAFLISHYVSSVVGFFTGLTCLHGVYRHLREHRNFHIFPRLVRNISPHSMKEFMSIGLL